MTKEKTELESNSKPSIDKLYPLFILLTIIAILWISSYLIIVYQIEGWQNRGTFGDTFGAINSLFSGLALAGIIYTILLQRKELSLQRQELIENRKELARSASAQEQSGKELKRQAENLKATARLNALITLINYYNDRESKYLGKNSAIVKGANEKRALYLEEIEQILNNKNR